MPKPSTNKEKGAVQKEQASAADCGRPTGTAIKRYENNKSLLTTLSRGISMGLTGKR